MSFEAKNNLISLCVESNRFICITSQTRETQLNYVPTQLNCGSAPNKLREHAFRLRFFCVFTQFNYVLTQLNHVLTHCDSVLATLIVRNAFRRTVRVD